MADELDALGRTTAKEFLAESARVIFDELEESTKHLRDLGKRGVTVDGGTYIYEPLVWEK